MKYGQIVEYTKVFGAIALNVNTNIKNMNKIARFYF
jgi:hypothetical protein